MDITVRHTGYTDPALRARKLDRDARILLSELDQRPDEPFTLFNLGSIAVERHDWQKALGFLKRSLARSAPTDSITRKLFAERYNVFLHELGEREIWETPLDISPAGGTLVQRRW